MKYKYFIFRTPARGLTTLEYILKPYQRDMWLYFVRVDIKVKPCYGFKI